MRDARELSSPGIPTDAEVDLARDALLDRGTYEDEVRGVSAELVADLRAALEGELGTIEWQHDPTELSRTGCAAAQTAVGGVFSESSRSLGMRSLDDGEGDKALEIVERVAHDRGFTDRSTIVSGDRSQSVHDFRSADGGRVTLVVGERVGVRVNTGCRLTSERMAELRAEERG